MNDQTDRHRLTALCINCGSNYGTREIYKTEAVRLGTYLAARGIEIIYGGADVGLMGEVANAALSSGGRVTGVIPRAIADKVGHKGLSRLHVVETMHERKKLMFDLSDGFIALPGGFGTLEEIFELLTWSQLGFHSKPCGFLNIAGYYDKLLDFLDYSIREGFVREEYRNTVIIVNNVEEMIGKFSKYSPVMAEKWIR
jgi:uncharacterized protein (TIGR00730 family)